MKKLIILLSLFVNSIVLFSQQNYKSGTAEYGFKSDKKLLDNKLNSLKSKLSKEMYEKIKKQFDNSQNFNDVTFHLKFNNELSLFEFDDKMNVKDNELSNGIKRLQIQADIKFNYFLKRKEVVKQHQFGGEYFLIRKPTDSLKWSLLNEKKKIGKYSCYKAVSYKLKKFPSGIKKILVTAWYTPDIPIPFGPYEYNGLPGLIVELKEGDNIIYLKKIEMSDNNIKIKSLKGTSITETEFEKIWRQYIPRRN